MEIVTTGELLAGGLDHAAIRAMVASGELQRVRRGAYLRGADQQVLAEDAHRALIAAVLRERPDEVLSHISAAVVHGLPVPLRSLDRVHVVRRRARPGGKRFARSYVHRITRDIQTAVVGGMAVTDLTSTVLDLIRILDSGDAVALADRALALGLDRDALLERVSVQRGWRGNTQAREVLHFADPRAESPGESWTRWAFHRAGLPPPRLQVEFFDESGRFVARPDFDWPEYGVAAEFDGEIKYGRLLGPGLDITRVIREEKDREERLRRASGRWLIRVVSRDLGDLAALRRTVLDAAGHASRPAG